MKERPILFSGPMVRAILAGTKTQTRRVVRGQVLGNSRPMMLMRTRAWDGNQFQNAEISKGYGDIGDQLWVRESGWEPKEPTEREMREGADTWPKYSYDADGIDAYNAEQYKEWGWKRRPSIFMPRWASRIALEVTGVRVELVREISEDDAKAEGITAPMYPRKGEPTYRLAYRHLWDSLNAKRGFGWDKNPWVWVIEFRRVT